MNSMAGCFPWSSRFYDLQTDINRYLAPYFEEYKLPPIEKVEIFKKLIDGKFYGSFYIDDEEITLELVQLCPISFDVSELIKKVKKLGTIGLNEVKNG